MKTSSPSSVQERKGAAFRRGIATFALLAVLTALEFWLSRATGGSAALLFVIGLAKAGLILQYFMHISSLWSQEGH